MSKKRVIVPYAVSILLLLASFFIGGPVLSIEHSVLPEGRDASYIGANVAIFLILWVITMIVVIVFETIDILLDKPVVRNPLGPYVVLTALSSVGVVVFEIVYLILQRFDMSFLLNVLFYLFAPIIMTVIYLSQKRSKKIRVISLIICSITVLILLWTIKIIRIGVYYSRGGALTRDKYCYKCLDILPVLCILLALGIILCMALLKKNSFKFKWCVLAVVLVVVLFVPTITVFYRERVKPYDVVVNRYSIIETVIEEKANLFGYMRTWSKDLLGRI